MKIRTCNRLTMADLVLYSSGMIKEMKRTDDIRNHIDGCAVCRRNLSIMGEGAREINQKYPFHEIADAQRYKEAARTASTQRPLRVLAYRLYTLFREFIVTVDSLPLSGTRRYAFLSVLVLLVISGLLLFNDTETRNPNSILVNHKKYKSSFSIQNMYTMDYISGDYLSNRLILQYQRKAAGDNLSSGGARNIPQ